MSNDTFDLTPQQYHGGLDKLWDALGLTGVQDEDVFTLAARAIKQGGVRERIMENLRTRSAGLVRVVLYPCYCGRLTVDEWYLMGDGIHKEIAVEVADVDEARAIYRPFFDTLNESHYIPEDDNYTSRDSGDNFIVTGSHCICKQHREASCD